MFNHITTFYRKTKANNLYGLLKQSFRWRFYSFEKYLTTTLHDYERKIHIFNNNSTIKNAFNGPNVFELDNDTDYKELATRIIEHILKEKKFELVINLGTDKSSEMKTKRFKFFHWLLTDLQLASINHNNEFHERTFVILEDMQNNIKESRSVNYSLDVLHYESNFDFISI